MAGIAGHSGVRSDQGKAILVLLDVLDGYLPAFDGVALFAFGAQLPAMDVSMAVSAGVADIGKDHFGVALGAGGQRCVHATQRVAGLVVIEVGHGTNWLPAHAGVARLARKTEIAVRASGRGLVLLGRENERRQNHQEQQHNRSFHWQYAPCVYFGEQNL